MIFSNNFSALLGFPSRENSVKFSSVSMLIPEIILLYKGRLLSETTMYGVILSENKVLLNRDGNIIIKKK